MIAFDNGPADGDYVRYIDTMAKEAASNALKAAATPMASSASSVTGFDDPVQARLRQVAAPRATTTANAAANTAANAAMRQVMSAGIVVPALGRALLSMVAGVLVAIVGFSLQSTSVIAVIAGIALFIAGFRQASNATVSMRERAASAAARKP